MKFFRRKRRQIKKSQEHAAQSDLHLCRLKEQRDEVRALSRWAQLTREQNHLTELFIASRK